MTKREPMYSMYVPHERVYTDVGDVSLTRQEFAEECDLNALMARYDKQGVWPLAPANAEPRYLDVSAVPDMQTAMHVMIEATNAFNRLPATVRREFDNDPMTFVEFAERDDSLPKLREWGLAPPEKVPEEPMRVRVIPDPVPPQADPRPPTQ